MAPRGANYHLEVLVTTFRCQLLRTLRCKCVHQAIGRHLEVQFGTSRCNLLLREVGANKELLVQLVCNDKSKRIGGKPA